MSTTSAGGGLGGSSCFRCDGTGELCNICGEAPGACECTAQEILDYQYTYPSMSQLGPCGDCDGTGD